MKTEKTYRVVISKVWKSAIVLYVFVVTTCKWSVNLFTNPNPVYSHIPINREIIIIVAAAVLLLLLLVVVVVVVVVVVWTAQVCTSGKQHTQNLQFEDLNK
jgi:hypothetical protein